MDAPRARLAISLVDLTNLRDDCAPADVDELCRRARDARTAAVCVWPDFVAQCVSNLAGAPVRVATVVNFPTGDERAFATAVLAERAVADGADEVDVVLPYRALAAGDEDRARTLLTAARSATAGRALLKVILETGELVEPDLIRRAAELAVECGADFVKTSTGKSPVSATPDAVGVMLDVIARADRLIGLKPSGGISSADDAERYLALAEAAMGPDYLDPATFRFGASGVLDALLAAERGDGAASSATADPY